MRTHLGVLGLLSLLASAACGSEASSTAHDAAVDLSGPDQRGTSSGKDATSSDDGPVQTMEVGETVEVGGDAGVIPVDAVGDRVDVPIQVDQSGPAEVGTRPDARSPSEAGGLIDAGGASDASNDSARAVDARIGSGYADACEAVANASFLSIEAHECGLGPTGVSMCRWRLAFTDGNGTRSLSWRLSDYSLTMSYSCDGFTIHGSMSGREDFIGTYDPATDILHWDQYDYERSAP